MLLFNSDGELCGYGREVVRSRRFWWLGPLLLTVFLTVLLLVAAVSLSKGLKRVEREHVSVDDLFLDAVRVGCPADPAYAHADECIRSRRGVGFLFVDDNGVSRVVPVVGVGRVK